jgi:uncharacterized membrane protein
MKKYILSIIILTIVFLPTIALAEEFFEYPSETVKGKVLHIEKVDDDENPLSEFNAEAYLVEVKILQGTFKGQVLIVENILSNNPVYDIPVEVGDKVIVLIEHENGSIAAAYITDFVRDETLLYLAIAFGAIMIILGKARGMASLVALIITAFCIIKIMLPLILRGYSPVYLAILITCFTSAVTYILIGGVTIKTVSAFFGTVGGVLIAGFLALLSSKTAHLTGLSAQDAQLLLFIPQNIAFNFRELLFAGIIIGASGAVMDVAISIASSMTEIYKANPKFGLRKLMSSGLNIGRDIMGTMSNTLILAYTGSALPLFILFMAYETNLVKISNLDLIATEVVRALTASIGLIMAIPITALSFGVITKIMRKR